MPFGNGIRKTHIFNHHKNTEVANKGAKSLDINPPAASSNFRRHQSGGRAGTSSACASCPLWQGPATYSGSCRNRFRFFMPDFHGHGIEARVAGTIGNQFHADGLAGLIVLEQHHAVAEFSRHLVFARACQKRSAVPCPVRNKFLFVPYRFAFFDCIGLIRGDQITFAIRPPGHGHDPAVFACKIE